MSEITKSGFKIGNKVKIIKSSRNVSWEYAGIEGVIEDIEPATDNLCKIRFNQGTMWVSTDQIELCDPQQNQERIKNETKLLINKMIFLLESDLDFKNEIIVLANKIRDLT